MTSDETSRDDLASFQTGGIAAVFTAGGGIGAALTSQFRDNQCFDGVLDLSRVSEPAIDLLTEASPRKAWVFIVAQGEVRPVFVATGFLHDEAQLVRTAAVELARRSACALCIALHPSTVATSLSAPFAANGLEFHPPLSAAHHLLAVVDQFTAEASGRFFDWRGQSVPG